MVGGGILATGPEGFQRVLDAALSQTTVAECAGSAIASAVDCAKTVRCDKKASKAMHDRKTQRITRFVRHGPLWI